MDEDSAVCRRDVSELVVARVGRVVSTGDPVLPWAVLDGAGAPVEPGDLVTAEATLDYGGDAYEVVFIFEFRDGRIARETAYWCKPFPPAEWRAAWVEFTDR